MHPGLCQCHQKTVNYRIKSFKITHIFLEVFESELSILKFLEKIPSSILYTAVELVEIVELPVSVLRKTLQFQFVGFLPNWTNKVLELQFTMDKKDTMVDFSIDFGWATLSILFAWKRLLIRIGRSKKEKTISFSQLWA